MGSQFFLLWCSLFVITSSIHCGFADFPFFRAGPLVLKFLLHFFGLHNETSGNDNCHRRVHFGISFIAFATPQFRFHAFVQCSAIFLCIAGSMPLYRFLLQVIWGYLLCSCKFTGQSVTWGDNGKPAFSYYLFQFIMSSVLPPWSFGPFIILHQSCCTYRFHNFDYPLPETCTYYIF